MCTHMRTCLVEDILDDEYGVLGLGHTITARKQFFCLKVKLICQRLWLKARSPSPTPWTLTPSFACQALRADGKQKEGGKADLTI